MCHSFIKKVAGYKLIKKRLQHSCFLLDCIKCFKNAYLEEPLQVPVNNQFRENKPPVPTRIRKDSSWSICSNESNLPTPFVFMWSVLTNRISSLLWPNYKFSLHLRAEVPNEKVTCISSIDNAVSQACEEMKRCEPETRFIWLWLNLVGTFVIL